MTFTDSIQVCFKKYADFDGSASRSEFWWFMLFLVVVSFFLRFGGNYLHLIFSLATLIPSLAAGARRLHDTGRSAWFLLLWLVPFIGWIILVVMLAQEGKSSGEAIAA
jgi:uncharacterized membrane protein YhaH (DUF805 family)